MVFLLGGSLRYVCCLRRMLVFFEVNGDEAILLW